MCIRDSSPAVTVFLQFWQCRYHRFCPRVMSRGSCPGFGIIDTVYWARTRSVYIFNYMYPLSFFVSITDPFAWAWCGSIQYRGCHYHSCSRQMAQISLGLRMTLNPSCSVLSRLYSVRGWQPVQEVCRAVNTSHDFWRHYEMCTVINLQVSKCTFKNGTQNYVS